VIRQHIALNRQLRHFVESSGLQWKDVTLRHERDDEGRIIRDDDRLEIAFRSNGKFVEVAAFAPSIDRDHRPDGKNILPLGKLSARIDGHIINGPLDPATWKQIEQVIHG
jgi:hypothetical protein